MAGIRLAEVGSASNDRSERTFESCLTIVASKQRDTFHDWLIAQSACRLGIERGRPRDGWLLRYAGEEATWLLPDKRHDSSLSQQGNNAASLQRPPK